MVLNRSAIIILLSAALVWFAAPESARAQVAPEPAAPVPSPLTPPAPAIPQIQRPLDLVATITMANGTAETFSREIDIMEIITLPDGRIEMVHLVLVSGGERNTHVWYNYSRVAKLSYRFITVEGRNRVKIRIVQPSVPTRELNERLDPLGPGDYR
jgi:hypothetical protein